MLGNQEKASSSQKLTTTPRRSENGGNPCRVNPPPSMGESQAGALLAHVSLCWRTEGLASAGAQSEQLGCLQLGRMAKNSLPPLLHRSPKHKMPPESPQLRVT